MFDLIRFFVFVIVSIALIALSWRSLRNPRSHGFYRFFAFEFTVALVLLNLPWWFRHPFSISQIISWCLLILSGFLVVHGFRLLRSIGKPEEGVEDTTVLVRQGAYRYIRHPLYASLLFLTWGAFLKAPSWIGSFLGLASSVALYLTALTEERENREKFGKEYESYIEETSMFIPFLF